jgi:hypothetical protein
MTTNGRVRTFDRTIGADRVGGRMNTSWAGRGRRVTAATCAVLALTLGLLVLGVPSASGQTSPPTLSGEIFFGANFDFPHTSPQCQDNGDGTTTYSLHNHGVAVGPYTGTFTEDITVTIGPRVLPQPFPEIVLPVPPFPNDPPIPGSFDAALFFDAAPLVDITVDFAVDSPEGAVSGTKTLSGVLPTFDATHAGACTDFDTAQVSGHYKDVRAFGILYEARIETPTGTFVDEGISDLEAREGFALRKDNNQFAFRFNDLYEDFTSDLTETVELKPGLGCGDVNHEHERRGECKNDLA